MKENKKRFQYPTEMKIEKFEYLIAIKLLKLRGLFGSSSRLHIMFVNILDKKHV